MQRKDPQTEVAIPSNRVKVSNAVIDIDDYLTQIIKGRNPLKSGQGF